jgi:hypothetical protein
MRQGNTQALTKWRELVSEQSQTGLNVAASCNQHGLRAWQFYEWKKRVRESEAARFLECRLLSLQSQCDLQ